MAILTPRVAAAKNKIRNARLPLQMSANKGQVRNGLLLSGLLVGLSFVTALIPLALYHVAQVAAALRLRTAYSLMLGVIVGCFVLGLVLHQDVFFLGTVVGLFWFPIFSIAITQRKRNKTIFWTSVSLFAPMFLALGAAFVVPRVDDLGSYLESRAQVLSQDLRSSGAENDPNTKVFLDSWQDTFSKLKVTSEFASLRKVASYDPWQRIAWLVFDSHAASFFIFGLLLNALASLVFLDSAFEQVEKLRAIVRYVISGNTGLAAKFVENLERLPLFADPESRAVLPVEVKSHRKRSEDELWAVNTVLLPKHAVDKLYLAGYEFSLDKSNSHWNLKFYALPLPLVFGAVFFLAGAVFHFGDAAALIEKAGPAVAIGSLVSSVLLAVLAVQGLLVAHQRLVPFAKMFLLLGVVLLGLSYGLDPYLCLTVPGCLGLLDYLYDLRGLKVASPRAEKS